MALRLMSQRFFVYIFFQHKVYILQGGKLDYSFCCLVYFLHLEKAHKVIKMGFYRQYAEAGCLHTQLFYRRV